MAKKKTQYHSAIMQIFYLCKYLQYWQFKTMKVLIRKKEDNLP